MKGFDMQSDRLDELYSKLLSRSEDFAELWFIARQVLILSHGNAHVESRFSINKSLLQQNMKNESLAAQRIVFDGIQHDGGYLKINISRNMLRYVRKSRKAYENAKEENGKRQTEAENQKVAKKRLSIELKMLKECKKAATTASSKSFEAFDAKIFAIEEKLKKFEEWILFKVKLKQKPLFEISLVFNKYIITFYSEQSVYAHDMCIYRCSHIYEGVFKL